MATLIPRYFDAGEPFASPLSSLGPGWPSQWQNVPEADCSEITLNSAEHCPNTSTFSRGYEWLPAEKTKPAAGAHRQPVWAPP
jgi:hypothetical protein